MTHPLIKLWQDCQDPAGLGVPYPANQDLSRLIEYAKSQHLIITVTPDTDAKRAALLKARDELDAQIAALTPAPVAVAVDRVYAQSTQEQIEYHRCVEIFKGAHSGGAPFAGQSIGTYTSGKTIYFGDY